MPRATSSETTAVSPGSGWMPTPRWTPAAVEEHAEQLVEVSVEPFVAPGARW
jgi:hypothetical protein